MERVYFIDMIGTSFSAPFFGDGSIVRDLMVMLVFSVSK